LACALTLAWGTGKGIGLQPDSAFYLDCAVHLQQGEGYATTVQDYMRPIPFASYAAEMKAGGLRPRPEVVFPPLYSYILASVVGLDPFRAARALGAFLLAVNVFLAGFIVHRYTAPSRLFAFAAAALMVGSESTLGLHTYALSEPLFLALTLVGLFLLSLFVERGAVGPLVGSGLAAGLAFLTRYAGGALVGAGVLAILIFRKAGLRRRLVEAAAMAALGCLPALGFMARNLAAAGAATNRALTLLAPPSGASFHDLKTTLSSWVFPHFYKVLAESAEQDILALVSLVLLAAVVVAAVLLLRRSKRSRPGSVAAYPRGAAPFALFLPVYAAYLLFAMYFVDPEVPLNYRILAPFFVAGVVAGLIELDRIARLLRPGARRTLAVIFGVYLAGHLAVGAAWLVRFRSQSGGYNNLEWRSGEMQDAVAAVGALPASMPILTNDNAAVYFLFWRDAYRVAPADWPARLAELAAGTGGGDAVVILFRTRMHLLRDDESPEAIERLLEGNAAVRPLVRRPTVAVYLVRGGG